MLVLFVYCLFLFGLGCLLFVVVISGVAYSMCFVVFLSIVLLIKLDLGFVLGV